MPKKRKPKLQRREAAAASRAASSGGAAASRRRDKRYDSAPSALSEAEVAALPEAERRRLELVVAMVSTTATRHAAVYHEGDRGAPATVAEALRRVAPHIGDGEWPRRRECGDVFVNGRPVEGTLEARLPVPCRVEYFEPRCALDAMAEAYPPLTREHVVHRDEHVAVLYKPAGLPTNPPKDQKLFSLRGGARRLLGCESVHVPSRLDLGTQGLVPVSVDRAAHSGLQRAFQARAVQKFYLLEAAADEWPGGAGGAPVRADHRIDRDPLHSVLRRASREAGQEADTTFSLVARGEAECMAGGGGGRRRTVVALAQPRTGRTHQIRVHAAALGLPLVNDHMYGGVPVAEPGNEWLSTRHPTLPGCGAMRLVAFALRFPHPITNESLLVTVPDRLLPPWAAAHRSAIRRVLEERLSSSA